jgi:hypothetical protein
MMKPSHCKADVVCSSSSVRQLVAELLLMLGALDCPSLLVSFIHRCMQPGAAHSTFYIDDYRFSSSFANT